MRLTVRSYDLPFGRWLHHAWTPGPDDPLAGVVERVTHSDGVAHHPRERVFPTGVVELMVHLAAPYAVVGARGTAEPCAPASLSGMQLRPFLLEPPAGRTAHLALRLAPATAHLLLAAPLVELAAPALDLGPVLGHAADELVEACGDAPTPEHRIAAAAAWARRRLATSLARSRRAADALTGPIAWAAARITERRGAVAIAELREATGLSKARFAADFRRTVGVGPKSYARLMRFGRALELLERHPSRPLAMVALDAGYYDQPHMTADFRELGELTPAQVRARERYWDSPAVVEPGG